MKKGKFWYSYRAKVLLFVLNVLSIIGIFAGIVGTGWHEFAIQEGQSAYSMAEDACVEIDMFSNLSIGAFAQVIRVMMTIGIPLVVLSVCMFIATTIVICIVSGHRVDSDEIKLTWIDRIPYLVVFSVLVTIISVIPNIVFDTEYFYELSLELVVTLSLVCFAFFYVSCVELVLTTLVRIKAKKFYETSLLRQFNRFVRFLSDKTGFPKAILGVRDYWRANNRFVVRFTVLLGLFTLVEFPFFAVSDGLFGHWLLYKLVSVPVFVWCAIQWTIVQDGIKDIAEGKLTEPISTDKMYFDFKTDIERLNSINEGVQVAVADQMRSERLKTELITNVSHDIKTPLTSIINYVDLLSKELGKDKPDDEKTKEYLEILGRHSNRLKKLIQDLIDASKATTGNINMDIDKVNVSMLINQALGEFEDKLNDASLTVVKHGLDESVFVQADGRYLWRVFDNLFINICKYSQPNTRVYLDIEVADDVVNISFKNISKEELNVTPEELMERFTRGDSSRNTEGSGLGLSIASSLVNMMGGSMKLDIDGDLFKVNVELKK